LWRYVIAVIWRNVIYLTEISRWIFFALKNTTSNISSERFTIISVWACNLFWNNPHISAPRQNFKNLVGNFFNKGLSYQKFTPLALKLSEPLEVTDGWMDTISTDAYWYRDSRTKIWNPMVRLTCTCFARFFWQPWLKDYHIVGIWTVIRTPCHDHSGHCDTYLLINIFQDVFLLHFSFVLVQIICNCMMKLCEKFFLVKFLFQI